MVAGFGRVFLGFRVKEPWVPDAAWFPKAQSGVEVVCSVSDCLAEPPPGWIDRWDFNRARCYDSVAAALETIPPAEEDKYVCFAYWLVRAKVNGNGTPESVDPHEVFVDGLSPLPAQPGTDLECERLGYDVVSVGSTEGFECSPLSCNGMAGQISVNRYCLLDDVEHALRVARRFDEEQPEPGDYYVVEVGRVAGPVRSR